MRSLALTLCLAAACASAPGVATRTWSGGSSPLPVVASETEAATFEVVNTVPHLVEVPRVHQRLNEYGRMTVAIWVRNPGRVPVTVELQAKFFDGEGRPLDPTGWVQVFVSPKEARQVELSCSQQGATTFKILVR